MIEYQWIGILFFSFYAGRDRGIARPVEFSQFKAFSKKARFYGA
jgi:hypothetical protein